MTRQTKLTFYAVGTALLLLSLYYVGSRIAANWLLVRETQVQSLPWLIASVVSYAACHITIGISWPLIVRELGTNISMRDGLRIGLMAQIGKYLPGNIAHYVGRGALATQHGVTLKSSGIATLVEFASAIAAIVVVATIGLLIDPRPIAMLPEVTGSTALIVTAVMIGMIAGWAWLRRKGAHPTLLAGPTVCITMSFMLAGISVYALSLGLGISGLPLAAATSSFALAWGAGFFIPGAPAGLGVREATLLALLSPLVGAGPVVAIAIVHRVLTATVDAAAALIGYGWSASGSFEKK